MEKLIQFKEYLTNEEKSNATIEKYIRDVSQMILWCCGREITKELAVEYKRNLMQKYKPSSINSIISSLNCYFIFNERYDLKLKFLKVQRQVYIREEKELTKQEYERLLNAAKSKGDERLYLIMQTICSTGIRVSELSRIDVNAINKETAIINNKGKIRRIFLPKGSNVVYRFVLRLLFAFLFLGVFIDKVNFDRHKRAVF